MVPKFSIDGPCEFDFQRLTEHGMESSSFDFDAACSIEVTHCEDIGRARVHIVIDAGASARGRPSAVSFSETEAERLASAGVQPKHTSRYVVLRHREPLDGFLDDDESVWPDDGA
jgi:hypothetical protein